jgi:hypothetical protein
MLGFLLCCSMLFCIGSSTSGQVARGRQEPAELNPFGGSAAKRDDAVPGYLELSSRSVRPGRLYLTRDAKLKIFDERAKQFREVPLQVIQRVDCSLSKEWMEKEWRFKENASDEKVYTGRSYPVREYRHKITLRDGRTIEGTLSAIVYLEAENDGPSERFLLHKRDKGPIGSDLKSLVYVRAIVLGEKALAEAKRKASKDGAVKNR